MTAAGVVAFLWIAWSVVACGEMQRMPSIQEVKARHEAQLLAVRGVVSVGIGRDVSGEAVIVVGVESSAPELESRLPRQLEGYSVTVHTTGRVRAHSAGPRTR